MYVRMLGRETGMKVGTSHVWGTVRDMHAMRCFDAGKFEACLRLAGLEGDSGKVGLPIEWKDGHWSCVLIDPALGQVQYYDSMGNLRNNEVFQVLEWLLGHWQSCRQYSSLAVQLPTTTKEDSGIATLWTLRCLALSQPLKWREGDVVKIRKVLVLELKRSLTV